MATDFPSRRWIALATVLAVIASLATMGAQIAFYALLEDSNPYTVPDYFGAMIIAGFIGIMAAHLSWPLAVLWAGAAYTLIGLQLLRRELPSGWRGHLVWIAAGLIVGATTIIAMVLERPLAASGSFFGFDNQVPTFWDEVLHLLPPGLVTGVVGAFVWRLFLATRRRGY